MVALVSALASHNSVALVFINHSLAALVASAFKHHNLAVLVYSNHNTVPLDLAAHSEVSKVQSAFKALNLPVLVVLEPQALHALVVG